MKALIVSSVYGFLSKFERQNVELLEGMNIEVLYASNSKNVVYEDNEDVLKELGVRYHDIPITQSLTDARANIKATIALRKLIKREKINIIHCHTPTGGMVARLACLGIKDVYVIYTAHGFHFYKGASKLRNRIYYLAEYFMSRNTNALVTINHEDETAAKTMRADCVYRIPGEGVDSKYYCLTDEEDKIKERIKLDIKKDDFFVISVGEVRKNKNQKKIIETIRYFENNNPNGMNIVYGIIGSGSQERALKKYVKKYHLEHSVRFYGYEVDIRKFLRAADVMVFPSIREGLGMAPLEAMFTGLPVIASSNRGSKEYIKDKKNGLLVYEDTVDAYAKAIQQMYLYKLEHKKYNRENIRESVTSFEKSESEKVMRKVYEDACSKCNVSGF
ncbi:Glycosyltransferase involved in cell wall bisynthesis [Pseudobutyrivibrio sp. UC1225]|uniref:glycosyltransferase family 4 protein n=1 Tax=Pseudobutyrivibrio sp. UC1225 TaxID=1798185 RepID=UPI0008F22742|nr:glycosyltransferase family 4 protein [Pseudobutyrivibrio sp. UC1225]SFN93698.1 Glycosyltransferase involved in cell wall bisynthesis [Pseudobutyrivibrio sp. UC1225]